MATVNKILLPRRGKKSLMKSPSKAVQVLEKGELFIECSDDGIGVGHAMIKIGDGATAYSDLGYAIGDTSNDEISFTESTDPSIDSTIGKITTDSKLAVLVSNIKRSIILLKNSVDTIKNLITALTGSNTIQEVKIVTQLPADAADHPNTLYFIKQS